MKKLLFILLVMVPLTVVAGQAYGSHLLQSSSQIGHSITSANFSHRYSDGSGILSGNDAKASVRVAHNAPARPFPDIKGDDKPGEDLDLRIVDWDKAKTDKKPKVAPAGENEKGDNGEENGNGEENEEENGQDEKDDGVGGWDRQWDCPKLG
ncbi:hypothetical protein [Desulfomonile tiedjei]|uniref:Uncharacterized protein n=1 Tax=Desulfomonile tiedjei (strain ATCC 49306 / DSM 6799 / DCB-1) TaxID=706587 RepID=I4C1J1_DESTA|nr:hypothetical protein [Desulfomonile tiedjei]AFM23432.1 hypothetical protein Desti_0706 [Desulfomonile tiedjei DSM 6799]